MKHFAFVSFIVSSVLLLLLVFVEDKIRYKKSILINMRRIRETYALLQYVCPLFRMKSLDFKLDDFYINVDLHSLVAKLICILNVFGDTVILAF